MIIEQGIYDGELIHKPFAYRFYRDEVTRTGNIIAFRSPMQVTANLIDLEDKINNAPIYSDDAINFCWEIPNLCPLGAVAFQRLFNTYISSFLVPYFPDNPLEIDGDDILVKCEPYLPPRSDGTTRDNRKLSVSITHCVGTTALGHTGINVAAGDKAPFFAGSTNLSNEQCNDFMKEVCNLFYCITHDMFVATSKVIV